MARVNRAIELLEAGQPVYFAHPAAIDYEAGLVESGTWADFLMLDYEHRPFDMTALRGFMRGLADAGPTRSGHRTPTVICTLPASGKSESEILANQWQITHLLNAGVHGLLLCRARDPKAVAAFVRCARYVFQQHSMGQGLGPGLRGDGGQSYAAQTWGISSAEYFAAAEPWPLAPGGELLLGLKLEDQEGAAVAEDCVAVPGLAFAAWGPGDMGMSFGYPARNDPPYPPAMDAIRRKIKAATEAAGLRFQMSWNDPALSTPERVEFLLGQEKVMLIPPGPAGQELADCGRQFSRRSQPA